MEQGSQAWIEWRKKGIGGSDIAAIVGACKYGTPYRVWSEKVGLSQGFAGNFATERGSDLEAKIRARYELITMEDMPPALAVHPKYDIVRVSLDGIRSDGRLILELKCPGKDTHDFAATQNKVPAHYVPQVQYELAATGADHCHYFSYGADDTHALVEVEADLTYQGFLINAALQFWEQHVLTNVPPALTDRDDKIVSDGEVVSICDYLLKHREAMPKRHLDQLKEKIILLGGHTRVRCGRVLVTRSELANGKESYRLTVGKEKP